MSRVLPRRDWDVDECVEELDDVLLSSMWVEEVLVELGRSLSPHPCPVPNELEDVDVVTEVVEVDRHSVPCSFPAVDIR
jgi:hypothetical protein